MSDCCATKKADADPVRRRLCPACGRSCLEVSHRTILHHLRQPWAWKAPVQATFYCNHSDCEVAYFAADESTILRGSLRRSPAGEGTKTDDLICHCFGVSGAGFTRDPSIKDFVIAMTRAGLSG